MIALSNNMTHGPCMTLYRYMRHVSPICWFYVFMCFIIWLSQNPGTLVNIPKAFKIDYLRVVSIPKKVPFDLYYVFYFFRRASKIHIWKCPAGALFTFLPFWSGKMKSALWWTRRIFFFKTTQNNLKFQKQKYIFPRSYRWENQQNKLFYKLQSDMVSLKEVLMRWNWGDEMRTHQAGFCAWSAGRSMVDVL